MSNTTISIKFSTESGNVPSSLANGELAINSSDGKLFYRKPSGTIDSIQNFSGPAGLDGEVQFNDSGDLGSSANLTFNKTTGNLSSYVLHTGSYVEFPDGTKQYTANAGGGGGESITVTVGLLPPVSGNTVGDLWIDSNTGIEFTWVDDGDSSQWIELGPSAVVVGGGGPVEGVDVIFAHANGAFDQANSANVLAQAAFDAANNAGSSQEVQTIYAHANGAFDKANSANVLAQAAFDAANNISFDGYATEIYVNTAVANLVNSAPTTLDTLNELATALGNDPNFATTTATLIGNSHNHANGAFDQANSANVLAQASFDKANAANVLAQAAFESGNSTYIYANSAFNTVNITSLHANSAYDKANAANVLAQQAYDYANTISLDGYATESYVANSLANLVNSAPTTLDTLNELAAALNNDPNFATTTATMIGNAYNQANAAGVIASSSYAHANGSFDQANSANVLAQASFDQANSANVIARAAFDQANTANLLSVSSNIVPASNVTYDLGTPTQRWKDLYLSGNTIDLAGVQISANGGALSLPPVVSIGSATIDGSAGGLILPSDSSIGGASVATPRVTSIDYPGDDTAADPAGGQVVGIVGAGFQNGASVLLDGQTIGVVTYVNSQRLEITTPAKATGSYVMYIINPDGGTGIFVPGIQYSGVPAWQSPAAGSLGSVYETGNFDQTFSANSDSAVTYSLYSGTLPPGSTLNSSTGVLSGTAALTDNATTYNFTIRATDGENQDTDRAFSLTINPDMITWVSPANGASYTLVANSSSSLSLSATSAAGDSVVYSANALPTGLSIDGSSITGTPNTEQTLSSLITARGNTTNSTATIVINWSVTVSDVFFKQTTLLLNGDVDTWISDASPNAFSITPAGDAKSSAFSPYNTNWGMYQASVADSYLNFGRADYNWTFTGDFTIEGWVYYTSASSGDGSFYVVSNGSEYFAFNISMSAGVYNLYFNSSTVSNSFSHGIIANQWTHVALVRSGSTITAYTNGVAKGSVTNSSTLGYVDPGINRTGGGVSGIERYISNFRIVRGSAVYTTNFTPATEPLTAITNTITLIYQSNRFVDVSGQTQIYSATGTPKVTSFGPFTETDTTTGSGYFDGTGDYLTVPYSNLFNFGSNSFTIDGWFYLTSYDVDRIIVSNYQNASLGFALRVTVDNKLGVNLSGDAIDITGTTTIKVNEWNHFALSGSSGSIKMFLNGVQEGSTYTSAIALDTSSQLTIGAIFWNSTLYSPWLGNLSSIRLIKGTALYTSNFTPPTSPLTAISNTSLLTLQSRRSHNNNTFLDDSGNKFNITRTGNATQGTFSPFSPSGWSVYFDGTGDWLTITDNAAFDLGSGAFTIEGWFNPSVLLNAVILDNRYGSTSPYPGYLISPRSDGTIQVLSENTTLLTGTIATPINQWSHFAVVRNGNSNLSLFINGVRDVTTSSSTVFNSAGNPVIGAKSLSASSLVPINGYLSNLRIVKNSAVYDPTLSTLTVPTSPLTPVANTSLLICRDNNFVDDGPNRFTITRNGDAKITPFSPFGPHTITPNSYSVYFDGNGDYLSVPNNLAFQFGTGDFTCEAWVYPIATPTSDYTQIVGMHEYGLSASWILAIDINLNLRGHLQTTSPSGTTSITGGTIALNTWSHVVMVRSGTTFSIYVNGVRVATTTTNRNIDSSGNNLTIGADNNGDEAVFTGKISNVRVVKGSAVYDATQTTITVPTSPPTSVSGTSLLTCQSPTIIDNSTNNFAITVNGNSTPTTFNPFGETVLTNVQYSPTTHGGSGYFDGSGDWLSSTHPNMSGSWSIDFWWYALSVTTQQTLVSFNSGSFNGINIWCNTSGRLVVDDGANAQTNFTGGSFVANQWNHIAVVRNGSTTTGYINGVAVGSHTFTPATVNAIFVARYNNASNFYTSGYISDLRTIVGKAVYNSNFVPTKILNNSNETLFLNFTNAGIQDSTGKNALETVGDTRIVSESPYSLNKSVYFNGSGDYLRTTGTAFSLGTGDFTVETWIYTFGLTGHLFDFRASSGFEALTFYLSSTGRLTCWTGSSEVGNTGTAITPNQWNHVAFSRTGGAIKAFLNGVEQWSLSIGSNINNNTFTIASSFDGAGVFTGYMSSVRLIKGSGIYTSNFTPSTTPLTAVSGTSLLTCQSYNFKDNSTNNFTITRYGNPKITSRGPFTETLPYVRSLGFDGTGDYLSMNGGDNFAFGSGDFTVEFWYYSNNSGVQHVVYDSRPSGVNGAYMAVYKQAGNVFAIYILNAARITGTISILAGSWYHIAVSRSGTSTKLFVNGIQDGSTYTDTNSYLNPVNRPLIGADSFTVGATPVNGLIDDLRITKYARYTSNFTPPTTPFLTF